jgi:TonB family protein
MKNHVFTMALCFALNCPAHAENSVYKSDCFPLPVEIKKVRELHPWLSTLDTKMKEEPGYERTGGKLTQDLGDKSIVCKMVVQPDGGIESLVVAKSSGLKHSDQLALRLIRTAAPFGDPPNDLPCGREGGYTEITFLNELGRLKTSVKEVLPPDYIKIGQQHPSEKPEMSIRTAGSNSRSVNHRIGEESFSLNSKHADAGAHAPIPDQELDDCRKN